MTRLKDLFALMAANITVNENRMRLGQLIKDKDAIEFWSTQFGSQLRVKTADFFMRFVFLDADFVPQRWKDFDITEKKIFVEVCSEKYEEDKTGDIDVTEMGTFFYDLKNDIFIVQKIDLEVQKRKYALNFSLSGCQTYCASLTDPMKLCGIDLVNNKEAITPALVKKCQEIIDKEKQKIKDIEFSKNKTEDDNFLISKNDELEQIQSRNRRATMSNTDKEINP